MSSYDYGNDHNDGAPSIRANTVRTHTAVRKTHICALCKKTIEIGQKYTRSFAIVDNARKPEIIHQHVGNCIHD